MSNNIDESFVHDTIRKLFIENNIPNSSEDIIYAKYSEDEEISKFFNIPLSEIKSSYNNDYSIKKLQLGRTDIVSRDINTKENNNDTTHGDFIIEIKNIKSWTETTKLLIYKQKTDDIPIALFFSKNEQYIPHNKKYLIYQTLNKFDIIVLFFDDLTKNIENFKYNFINCIEFNFKNISKGFCDIVSKRIEYIRNEKVNINVSNISEHITNYDRSLEFISMFDENQKCKNIKTMVVNTNCANTYAALSVYLGKITLVKNAIDMKATNFNEMIKLSIQLSRSNILSFLLAKYNNIRKSYIKHCKNLKILEIIKKYYKQEIDYDGILDNFLNTIHGISDKINKDNLELLKYLLNRTDKKLLKYNNLFEENDIKDIIINKKICIEFNYQMHFPSKYFVYSLITNNLYRGTYCNAIYNDINLIKAFENDIKYFDEVIKNTSSSDVLEYCICKPLLNKLHALNALESIIKNSYINYDTKFCLIRKISNFDESYIDHIIYKITDTIMIEKFIDNGYRNFRMFCNNFYIINKYIKLLNVQDLLDISVMTEINEIVKLCVREGAFNFNEIAKQKNRNFEVIELCVKNGADNFNEIAANNMYPDVVKYCINKGANNYKEILKNCHSEEIIKLCIEKGFKDFRTIAAVSHDLATIQMCIANGADNFEDIFNNIINIYYNENDQVYDKFNSYYNKNNIIYYIFDTAESIQDKLNDNILTKLVNILNLENVTIIFNYKNILKKLMDIKNLDVLCKIIELLSEKDNNVNIDENNFELNYCYNKIFNICEQNKYRINDIITTLIKRTELRLNESLYINYAHYLNICSDKNVNDSYMYINRKFLCDSNFLLFKIFPYIDYILLKYKKYLNFDYLYSFLLENNYLFLSSKLIQYANINSNGIYNKLTFREYKGDKSIHIKCAYNELYKLIIQTCTIYPNDIALKAVNANNVNVLKLALKMGSNNTKELITKCKPYSKIYSLLEKNL